MRIVAVRGREVTLIETSPRLGMTIVEGVRTLLPAPGQPCLTLYSIGGNRHFYILNILLIYSLAYIYDYSAMIFMGIVSGELF